MSTEVFADSEPIAKKRHRCTWCGEHVESGEKYHVQTGKFEGDFYTNRLHMECWNAMGELHRIDRFAVEDGFELHGFKRGTCEQR